MYEYKIGRDFIALPDMYNTVKSKTAITFLK